MKTTPIYLDRLSHTLSTFGVNLKRSQLLEIAASSFGYHNSNEFTAASKRGDLTPPAVIPIGTFSLPDGQKLVVVRDERANAPYAIDETFLEQVEQRREQIGLTPYGYLAYVGHLTSSRLPELKVSTQYHNERNCSSDVTISRAAFTWLLDAAERYADDLASGLADGTYEDQAGLEEIKDAIQTATTALSQAASPPQSATPQAETSHSVNVRIFSASIEHKYGPNFYGALTQDDLYRQLAKYCTERWQQEIAPYAVELNLPEEPFDLSDEKIVRIYFETVEHEALTYADFELEVPGAVAAHLNTSIVADVRPDAVELPGAQNLNQLAADLRTAAAADIWFRANSIQSGSYPHERK